MRASNQILLTIDVEDWFQVENFKKWIPFSSWQSYELRVEKNTHRLLDLLDSIKLSSTTNSINPTNSPKATFFVLGWIAERLPHLVREIHSRGHEVASHGLSHNLCKEASPKDLETDLIVSKELLEDIIGDRVYGYRAPSFSINDDILRVIQDCGYSYDSSYNSFGTHGRYGHLDLSQNVTRGIAFPISSSQQQATSNQHQSSIVNRQSSIFFELPISNMKIGNRVLPWGGGAYFRLIPSPLFKIGVEFMLKQENAYLFYLHPWEIDYDQPRVNDTSVFYKIRHYVNLRNTHSKLSKFIESFSHCNFITCSQYLDQVRKVGPVSYQL